MMAVVTSTGVDITGRVYIIAAAHVIPVTLLVGAGLAESRLNPFAERWGSKADTERAIKAIKAGDMHTLQTIIDRWWPDISFGISQRIVKYHDRGNRSQSWQNCLDVRAAVFADLYEDIDAMARRLAANLRTARNSDLSRIDGDELLGACIIYNAGHWPEDNEAYWTTHATNVVNYRNALAEARAMIGDDSPADAPDTGPAEVEGDTALTIEERAEEMGAERLGNGGTPETDVLEFQTTDGQTIRVQAFWNGSLLELPKPDGSRTVYSLAEGSNAEAQRAFRGGPG